MTRSLSSSWGCFDSCSRTAARSTVNSSSESNVIIDQRCMTRSAAASTAFPEVDGADTLIDDSRSLSMKARVGLDQLSSAKRNTKLPFHAVRCGSTRQPKIVAGRIDDQSIWPEIREDCRQIRDSRKPIQRSQIWREPFRRDKPRIAQGRI